MNSGDFILIIYREWFGLKQLLLFKKKCLFVCTLSYDLNTDNIQYRFEKTYMPFCWFCPFIWSSCGVDPDVNSHTQHFTGWIKKTDKHGFRIAKHNKVKLTFFRIFCVFFMWELSENTKHSNNADSSGHRLHHLRSGLHTALNFWTHVLEAWISDSLLPSVIPLLPVSQVFARTVLNVAFAQK